MRKRSDATFAWRISADVGNFHIERFVSYTQPNGSSCHVQKILKSDKKNTAAFELSENIKRNLQKNRISLQYDRDDFNKLFDPWDGISLSYSRRTKTFGSVIARLNYANRFLSPGYQFELDAYPSLGKKMYAYLNVGYSADAIFPEYKWSASIYRNLGRAFEGDAIAV